MTRKIKILHLEDRPTDAELIAYELEKGNINCEINLVDTEIDFINALHQFAPDVILSDHSLPTLNSMVAFRILKEKQLNIPFILITANVSESFAVDVMKEGMTDYILKDRLSRLPMAVLNAVEKKSSEDEKQKYIDDLAVSERRLRNTFENMSEGVQLIDTDWKYIYVNDALTKQGHYPKEKMIGRSIHELYPGVEQTELYKILQLCMNGHTTQRFESEFVFPDKSVSYFELRIQSVPEGIFILSTDITERKRSELKILKANRLYAFISAINQSIVHIKNEQELLDKACTISIQTGGFKKAWIGLLNTEGALDMMAILGDAAINTELKKHTGMDFSIDMLRNTPTAKVLNTGNYVIDNDVVNNPETKPWKDEFIKHGIRSNMTLPLKKFGNVAGIFSLSATTVDFFDAQEITLLIEAAGDISFALENYENEKLREKQVIQLAQNERRLNKAQSIAHIGHWELDFATGLSMWSEEALKIYGLEPGNTIQPFEVWVALLHPEEKNAILKRVQVQRDSLRAESFKHRILRKDGSVRHLHTESMFEFDDSGKPIGIYGVSHDITEEWLADEKLMMSEAKLREAQALARVGNFEIDMTSNSLYWSDEQYRILGYQPGEIEPDSDLFLSMVHPDDAEAINKKFHEAFQQFVTGSFAFSLISKDKTLKHVNCEWRFEFDANSKPLRLYGIVQDITEKKETEKQLQATHDQLLFHIENTPLGFIEWDINLNVKSWSKQAEVIFGWTEKECIGNRLDGYAQVHPDDLPWASEIAGKLLRGEVERNQLQHRNIAKDGRVIWCEWFNSALKDKNGNVTGIMSLVHDASERKLAQDELQNTLAELEYRVVERTKELGDKNKSILDSINYAKRIQLSLLPAHSLLKNIFPHSFILSRPRDIVSGDFFWCYERRNKKIIVVADCTGHGVPGALMSIIGNNLLNRIIINEHIENPSEILEMLDIGLKEKLNVDVHEIHDGMDISICVIDTSYNELYFAGALQPAFIVDEHGAVTDLLPSRYAIGADIQEEKKRFETTRFAIKHGQRIYMSSDGYYSQFGGPKEKKLMKKGFRNILTELQSSSFEEHKTILQQRLTEWSGSLEQVDDILVLGIEL